MSAENDIYENRDPISGEKGAHPVGTGIGAVLGGAAGMAGTVAAAALLGPAGVVVGAAIGAVAGGLVGKGAAEAVNPTEHDDHWRQQLRSEPYYEDGESYADYEPAYKVGREGRSRFTSLRFEEVERDLEQDYVNGDGRFGLPWEKARHAARAAWDHATTSASADAATDFGQQSAADGEMEVTSLVSPLGNAMPFEQPRTADTRAWRQTGQSQSAKP